MTEIEYVRVRNLSQIKAAAALLGDVAPGGESGLSEERINHLKADLAELVDDAFEAVGELEESE